MNESREDNSVVVDDDDDADDDIIIIIIIIIIMIIIIVIIDRVCGGARSILSRPRQTFSCFSFGLQFGFIT